MRIGWLVLTLVATVAPAVADPTDEVPWARGVDVDKRVAAAEQFEAGNREFEKSRYTQALAAYERALALWDSPAIQYNAAVCLMHLGRLLEAHERLVKSLAYGAAPFDGNLYEKAVLDEKLVRGQLAELSVHVDQPGASITVDGAPLAMDTPKLFARGDHQIVVSKPGFTTDSRRIELRAGDTKRIEIHLERPGSSTIEQRRWPRWVPGAVVGGGAAVAVAGVAFHVHALSLYRRYDDKLAVACPDGCTSENVPDGVARVGRRGDLFKYSAISAYVLGGGAIAAGVTMFVLNRGRMVERKKPMIVWSGKGLGLSVIGEF